MSPVAVVLLAFGAVSEFTGIVLIAFPDLLPHARRLSRWLGHRTRVVVNRVRRLLGLPPLQKAGSISAAVSANAAMRASADQAGQD